MLTTSISSRAIGKKSGRNAARNRFSLRTRLRDKKAHEIISLNSPFYCLKGRGEGEDVLSNLFFGSFSFLITNDLADGSPAIFLREIILKKKKFSVSGSFLR